MLWVSSLPVVHCEYIFSYGAAATALNLMECNGRVRHDPQEEQRPASLQVRKGQSAARPRSICESRELDLSVHG